MRTAPSRHRVAELFAFAIQPGRKDVCFVDDATNTFDILR